MDFNRNDDCMDINRCCAITLKWSIRLWSTTKSIKITELPWLCCKRHEANAFNFSKQNNDTRCIESFISVKSMHCKWDVTHWMENKCLKQVKRAFCIVYSVFMENCQENGIKTCKQVDQTIHCQNARLFRRLGTLILLWIIYLDYHK